jgi:hypothetical protein
LTVFFMSLEEGVSVRTKCDFLVGVLLHLADGDMYDPSTFFTRLEGVSSRDGSMFSESSSHVKTGE